MVKAMYILWVKLPVPIRCRARSIPILIVVNFVSKLKGSLDSIYYSTVFGTGNSRPNISPTAFLVILCKNIYVNGWGALSGTFGNFSTVMADAYKRCNKKDYRWYRFLNIVLGKDASSLLYASYFGGK